MSLGTMSLGAGIMAACKAKGDAGGTTFVQDIGTTEKSGTFNAFYKVRIPCWCNGGAMVVFSVMLDAVGATR